MVKPDEPVEDHEELFRTNYSPEHIVDGKVIVSAISSKDLTERGFSVDRALLVNEDTIINRAETQMAKDPEKRGEAYISVMNSGNVRAEICAEDKKPAFKIENQPIYEIASENISENLAHAGILSAESRTRSLIKALKLLLIPHLNAKIIDIQAYFGREDNSLMGESNSSTAQQLPPSTRNTYPTP